MSLNSWKANSSNLAVSAAYSQWPSANATSMTGGVRLPSTKPWISPALAISASGNSTNGWVNFVCCFVKSLNKCSRCCVGSCFFAFVSFASKGPLMSNCVCCCASLRICCSLVVIPAGSFFSTCAKGMRPSAWRNNETKYAAISGVTW